MQTFYSKVTTINKEQATYSDEGDVVVMNKYTCTCIHCATHTVHTGDVLMHDIGVGTRGHSYR